MIIVFNYSLYDLYNTDGSGLNDATSGFVDSNFNDDNGDCFNNFGNFIDNDCKYGFLQGFIPPKSLIQLGKIYFLTSYIFYNYTGVFQSPNGKLSLGCFAKQGFKKKVDLSSFSGEINFDLPLGSYDCFLKNFSSGWVYFYFSGIYNVLSNKGSKDNILLKKNFDFYIGGRGVLGEDIVFETGFNIRPINPVGFGIISGDFNDGGSDNCQGTGDNDIVLSWYFTGDYNLSGEYQFEILSGNDINLGNVLTGLKLIDLCVLNDSGNWQCQWTGYDYNTGNYYFKVNSRRCINGDCGNKLKRV